MARHPVDGVEGSKPRVSGAAGNGKVSKAELSALNREYLKSRNRTQAAKAFMAETQAAEKQGILISKKWAFASLSYLLVCCRQRALLAPKAIAEHLVRLGLLEEAKQHSASEAIREDIYGLLDALANLPEKVTDPNWLETLEKEEGRESRPERAMTPEQVKSEQARTSRRRVQKTEAMRRLRS